MPMRQSHGHAVNEEDKKPKRDYRGFDGIAKIRGQADIQATAMLVVPVLAEDKHKARPQLLARPGNPEEVTTSRGRMFRPHTQLA